jgi:hypothetical protein
MSRTQDEIAGAGAGAATGAAVGSVAGPEGALVGGLLGALFGALMGDLAHVTPETAKSAPSPIANRDDPMDASDDPFCTPDTVMGGVPHKRPINPIETPKPKRVYEEVDNKHEKFRLTRYDWFCILVRVTPLVGAVILVLSSVLV